jgi:hypothetical protein
VGTPDSDIVLSVLDACLSPKSSLTISLLSEL